MITAPLEISTGGPGQGNALDYPELRSRVRDLIRLSVPPGATALVVSKGDDELVRLGDGRVGWHFPRAESGQYAGFHPADSAAAIEHLGDLQARGARFLVIPATAYWWLDHYSDFARHLARYRVAAGVTDVCVVFALDGRQAIHDPQPVSSDRDSRREHTTPTRCGYGQLDQIRALVASLLPERARLVVVTDGDEELLGLDRRAWSFPRTITGGAGEIDPDDHESLLEELEHLRAGGGEYLVVPSALAWRVDACGPLRSELYERHRLVTRQHHVCEIFELVPGAPRAEVGDRD